MLLAQKEISSTNFMPLAQPMLKLLLIKAQQLIFKQLCIFIALRLAVPMLLIKVLTVPLEQNSVLLNALLVLHVLIHVRIQINVQLNVQVRLHVQIQLILRKFPDNSLIIYRTAEKVGLSYIYP